VATEKQRIAETESLFREVNERIAETAERFDADEVDFQCECADVACHERVEAPLDEYERVREHATRFLIAHGHERPQVERVVAERRGYTIVEKIDDVVAHIVRNLDPRTETT
jgi:hypothetical protein